MSLKRSIILIWFNPLCPLSTSIAFRKALVKSEIRSWFIWHHAYAVCARANLINVEPWCHREHKYSTTATVPQWGVDTSTWEIIDISRAAGLRAGPKGSQGFQRGGGIGNHAACSELLIKFPQPRALRSGASWRIYTQITAKCQMQTFRV